MATQLQFYKSKDSPTLYAIYGNKKYPIQGWEEFIGLGGAPESIQIKTSQEIQQMHQGGVIAPYGLAKYQKQWGITPTTTPAQPTTPAQRPSPQKPVAPTMPAVLPQASAEYESQLAAWRAKEPAVTVGPEWQAWRESMPTTTTSQQSSMGTTQFPVVPSTGKAKLPVTGTETRAGDAGAGEGTTNKGGKRVGDAVTEGAGAPAIPSVQDYVSQLQETTTKQFEDLTTKLLGQREEFETEQKDFLEQIGEKANKNLMARFETMQTDLQNAYQSYWDEQTTALEELKNQPSYLDQLEQFRQQQGLPQIEQQLAMADQVILDTERLLENLQADIQTRVEGLPVSEAAARKLEAMEREPLSKQLSQQLRARQRVAAGYETKQAAVQQFMTAAQADIQRQQQITEMGLGFAKEQAEFGGNIAQQGFDLFQNLQDRMIEVGKLGLGFAENATQFRENLATQGFNLFAQFQAQQLTGFTTDLQNQLSMLQMKEQKDENERQRQFDLEKMQQDFANDLVLEQLKIDLQNANPEIVNVNFEEDRSGNITQVVTWSDGKKDVTSLGRIGAGKTTTGGGGYDLRTTLGGALGMSDELANKFNSDFEEEYERLMKGDYGTEGAREKVARALIAKYPAYESQIWGIIYGNEQFESRFPEGYEAWIGKEKDVVGNVAKWEYDLGVRPGMTTEQRDKILKEGRPITERTITDEEWRAAIRTDIADEKTREQIADSITTNTNLTEEDKKRGQLILKEMMPTWKKKWWGIEE